MAVVTYQKKNHTNTNVISGIILCINKQLVRILSRCLQTFFLGSNTQRNFFNLFFIHSVVWIRQCSRIGSLTRKTLYKGFENVETWDKAQAICRQKGGHLPVIRDERMRDFVYNLMGQSHQMLFHGNWLGLTDRQKAGQWLTWDGKEPPFLFWGKGEPNDQGRQENCCVLAENNVMNNVPCGTPEWFYCQIKTDTLIKREAEKYSTKLSNFLSKFEDRKTGQ